MYRHGYYQCALHVMCINIKMDLHVYFIFGPRSLLIQSPLKFVMFISSIKSRRKGKEGRGRQKKAYFGENTSSSQCIQYVTYFVWYSRWKKKKDNSFAFLLKFCLEVNCKGTWESILQNEIKGTVK